MRLCEIKGCNRKYWGRINGRGKKLCNRHYMQMRLYGENFKSTGVDGNDMADRGDYLEMVLRGKRGKEIARTKFNKQHLEKVMKHHWSLANWGYCRCAKLKTSLHRFILNAPPNKYADHINGDRLDNRDENLRLVNKSQNSMNSNRDHLNKWGRTGIYFDKRDNCFYARIKINGKSILLGSRKKLNDAIALREKAENKYFGEYKRA